MMLRVLVPLSFREPDRPNGQLDVEAGSIFEMVEPADLDKRTREVIERERQRGRRFVPLKIDGKVRQVPREHVEKA